MRLLLQASHTKYYHSHQSLEERQSWAQSPSEAQEKNQHTQTLPPVSGLRQQGGTSQQRSTAKATTGSNRAHTQPSLETGTRGDTTSRAPGATSCPTEH